VVKKKTKRRRAYSPVRIDRAPGVELPQYLTARWERIVQGLAAEISYQEENGPKFGSWYEVIAEAVWQIGRVAFYVRELQREGNPDKPRAYDAISEYLRSVSALCIRWWATHEDRR
jgi:hypothetical protein